MQENSESTLFLNFSESFVEVASLRQGDFKFQRSFSPKTNLKNLLSEQPTFTNVIVCTQLSSIILSKHIGSSPAYLVTSGFEDWLNMNIPIREKFFTLNISRAISPVSDDLVFSINERTDANGHIRKAVNLEDLEFLTHKLKMNNIQCLAINFLHSDLNPTNEQTTAKYFRDQGFIVFSSQEISQNYPKANRKSERRRWLSALLNAYAYSTWQEELASLEALLREVSNNNSLQMKIVTNTGSTVPWKSSSPIETLFSHEFLCSEYFKSFHPNSIGCLWGVERFQIFDLSNENCDSWNCEFGNLTLDRVNFKNLCVQPTSIIDEGFWGTPQITPKISGYEPGPMCLGKSVKPTLLDVLFLDSKLSHVQGLTEHLVEKSSNRIKDTLFSYNKNSLNTEFLLDSGVQSLAGELNLLPQNNLSAAGPLAPAIVPLIKAGPLKKRWLQSEDFDFPALTALIRGSRV